MQNFVVYMVSILLLTNSMIYGQINNLDNLNGNVSSLEHITYETKCENEKIIDKHQIYRWIYKFNINGKILEIKNLSPYAKPYLRTCTYDKNDSLIRECNSGLVAGLDYCADHTYDGAGHKTLSVFSSLEGDFLYKVEYLYNEKGLLLERNIFKERETHESRQTFIYNEQNNLIEDITIEHDTLIRCKWLLVYDYEGRLIRKRRYYLGTMLDFNMNYRYNMEGELIEKSGSKISCPQKIFTYHYNDNGDIEKEVVIDTINNNTTITSYNFEDNVTTIEYLKKGYLSQKVIQEKDQYGNIVKSKEYNYLGERKSYEMYKITYDKKGNWIKSVKYLDFVPTVIQERKILYF